MPGTAIPGRTLSKSLTILLAALGFGLGGLTPAASSALYPGGAAVLGNQAAFINQDLVEVRAVARRTTVVGPRGGVARRTTVRRGAVVRPGMVRPGGWVRPARYGWPRGGAIAAGAAIGFVTAATAAAWAGAAPAPGMCWYYTDPSRTQGFWDYCQ